MNAIRMIALAAVSGLYFASVAEAQVNVYYPPPQVIVPQPQVTYYAPAVTTAPATEVARTAYYAPVPSVTSPTIVSPVVPAPTTVYYPPASGQLTPTTAYYAPAATYPVQRATYYAPAATFPVQRTTYYAPANVATPVVPMTTGIVTPTVVGRGVLGQPTAYVPGQPIRNALRWATP